MPIIITILGLATLAYLAIMLIRLSDELIKTARVMRAYYEGLTRSEEQMR